MSGDSQAELSAGLSVSTTSTSASTDTPKMNASRPTTGPSRTLRHKERQRYLDDEGLTPTFPNNEEGEGPGFNLEEKLASDAYNAELVQEIKTTELNLKYLQLNGFHSPLLFHNKEGLGMKVPSPEFSVNDVKHLVGAKRLVDVVDVQTQKGSEMQMKDFVKYYQEKPEDRKQLLNVISLEFSKTKMEPLVQAPTLVRQIDWVESVWPRDLKDIHSDSTNNIKTMKYPKVQKYVLMSVEKCYTDFHIDFGGTSVWYHVLRGKKIFWLIPSTAENFELYIDWTLSGNQDKLFFGDIVAQCQRVTLVAGDTFMIPTGWIHAVYTPEDSLVFGGNFLHSYNMTKQLQVAAIEDNTRVPEKFCYPLFHEMHWYVLERYVNVLTGNKSFLVADAGVDAAAVAATAASAAASFKTPKLLSSHEIEGLEQLILFLEHSSPASKVPHKIRNSAGLVKAGKQLLSAHRNDDPVQAVTGIPILPPQGAGAGPWPTTQRPSTAPGGNGNQQQQQQQQQQSPMKPNNQTAHQQSPMKPHNSPSQQQQSTMKTQNPTSQQQQQSPMKPQNPTSLQQQQQQQQQSPMKPHHPTSLQPSPLTQNIISTSQQQQHQSPLKPNNPTSQPQPLTNHPPKTPSAQPVAPPGATIVPAPPRPTTTAMTAMTALPTMSQQSSNAAAAAPVAATVTTASSSPITITIDSGNNRSLTMNAHSKPSSACTPVTATHNTGPIRPPTNNPGNFSHQPASFKPRSFVTQNPRPFVSTVHPTVSSHHAAQSYRPRSPLTTVVSIDRSQSPAVSTSTSSTLTNRANANSNNLAPKPTTSQPVQQNVNHSQLSWAKTQPNSHLQSKATPPPASHLQRRDLPLSSANQAQQDQQPKQSQMSAQQQAQAGSQLPLHASPQMAPKQIQAGQQQQLHQQQQVTPGGSYQLPQRQDTSQPSTQQIQSQSLNTVARDSTPQAISQIIPQAIPQASMQQQLQHHQNWKQQHEQYLQQQQLLLQQNYPNTSFSTRAPSPSTSSSSGPSAVVIPAPALTFAPVAAPQLHQQPRLAPPHHQLHVAPHPQQLPLPPHLALQMAAAPPGTTVAAAANQGAVHMVQPHHHAAGTVIPAHPSFLAHPNQIVASQQHQIQAAPPASYSQIGVPQTHPVAAYPVTTFIQSYDSLPQLQHQHHIQNQQQQPPVIAAAAHVNAVCSTAPGIPVAVVPHQVQQSQQQQPPTLSPQPMAIQPQLAVVGGQQSSSHSGTDSPCYTPLTALVGGPSRGGVGGGETPPTFASDLASMPRSDESPMDVYDPSRPTDKSMSKRSASARRRRTRCRRCLACTRSDCGDCVYCKDMKKFGGPGRMKQSCLSRQCMAPVLPHTAVCMICGDDERIAPDGTILLSGAHAPPGSEADSKTTLMECGICWEILHPKCLLAKLRLDPATYSHLNEGGNVNQELPNSWECPKCCLQGKSGSLKPRILKQGGRGRSSSGSRASSPSGSLVGAPPVGLSSIPSAGRGSSQGHYAGPSSGFYPINPGAPLSQDALQQLQQLQQRQVRESRSSTPASDDDESDNENSNLPPSTFITQQQQQQTSLPPSLTQERSDPSYPLSHSGLYPGAIDDLNRIESAGESEGSSAFPLDEGVGGTRSTGGLANDAAASEAADAGDSSATEEGDGGERIMMMVASEKIEMASNGSGADGVVSISSGGGAFVERTDGFNNSGTPPSAQKKKTKKRKMDEAGDSPPSNGSSLSPRKRIKMPSCPSYAGTLGVGGVGNPVLGGLRDGVSELAPGRASRGGGGEEGSDNESESESEGEMTNGGGGAGGGGASSGGNSSDSDTGDNSKDGPPRANPHHFTGGKANSTSGLNGLGGEDYSFSNGASPAALTPKQLKKQLKGKLKSMTRLEKAKWLKRAKKELVKRFGSSFDGDPEEKVKVEPEAEDDTGRRNEETGDDVFQIRGSKTLADLRITVEKYIVRTWEENKDEHEEDPTSSSSRHTSDDAIWFNVFRHFSRNQLCQCALVSRSWFKWANDQRLWKHCAIRNRHIKAPYLIGLVRRQPESLDLSWTDLDGKQLLWLLQRLPRLKSLRLAGLSQSTVEALGSTATPLLRTLDLAEADSITDAIVRDVIGPPADYRPGIFETKSRMRYLTSLTFKGCNISDITLRFLTIHLKFVESLNLSYCTLISDDGLDALTGNEGSAFPDSLRQIFLVGLGKITGQALTHLSRCSSLVEIDLTNCAAMTEEACRLFIALNVHMPLTLVPESNFKIRANNSFLPQRPEEEPVP